MLDNIFAILRIPWRLLIMKVSKMHFFSIAVVVELLMNELHPLVRIPAEKFPEKRHASFLGILDSSASIVKAIKSQLQGKYWKNVMCKHVVDIRAYDSKSRYKLLWFAKGSYDVGSVRIRGAI